MRAHDAYLTTLLMLGGATFSIPVYQRNYNWDQSNCQQLFEDIESVAHTGKDHFIGSIVYISIGTGTRPYYNIIDGQQRITSVMLLLKALCDCMPDKGVKSDIQRSFLTVNDSNGDPKVKLKQIESDSAVYEKIISADIVSEDSFSPAERSSHVYDNYAYFRKRIESSTVSPELLYNALFKLEIIDVCLTTEDPQEVFESMNSTGKGLSNTDLLRNYLLMGLPQEEQTKLYKNYWSQIEKNVGSMMDFFVVFYLILKRKSDSIFLRRRSSKINRNTVYDCYKTYIPADEHKREMTESLLKDMCAYSSLYKRIINKDDRKSEIGKTLYELTYELNADSCAIFLMHLLSIENVSDEDLAKALKACASYVFRVRLMRGSISNQFFALAIQYFDRSEAATFVDRVWDALTAGQGSYRFPKDDEFEDAMATRNIYLEFKPQMIRYILYKYERARTKEVVEPDQVTIEHILPQEPKKWAAHLEEIQDTEYEDYIHKLGNLTLTKYNGEASNEVFKEKKKIYLDSGFKITRDIAAVTDWNTKEIKARSKEMAKEALALWPLPDRYNKTDFASTGQYFGMDEEIEDLYNYLCNLISAYCKGVYEVPNKSYVNFYKDNKVVFSVLPFQTKLFVTLTATVDELGSNPHLEDISSKSHWGIGESRLQITSTEDAWQVVDYITKILERN